jgi:hypothetical protein
MRRQQSIALPPCTPTQLLSYTLEISSYPTTFIICDTQASFLEILLREIRSLPLEGSQDSQPSYHGLLPATLQTLSLAPHIQLLYAPTLSHLRALLSVSNTSSAPPPPEEYRDHEKERKHVPKLIVWNLVHLHDQTSDWSVQGLGSTLAALIELGAREGKQVIVIEDIDSLSQNSEVGEGEFDEEEGDVEMRTHSQVSQPILAVETPEYDAQNLAHVEAQARSQEAGIYARRLPMLNGSARREILDHGPGRDELGWSGRTVEVGVVMERWFQFHRSV